ncbi:hypothetical protein [Streptomyces avermitilis]|uniref:hypothetical protein n=1 Tax=Streptomyces avermitilis TaxID=33903 RepID=UPI00368CFC3C
MISGASRLQTEDRIPARPEGRDSLRRTRDGVHEAGLADENATGLICWRCGYVHLFVNKDIKLYRADK